MLAISVSLVGGPEREAISTWDFRSSFISHGQWEVGVWKFLPQPMRDLDSENFWSGRVVAVSGQGVWYWEPRGVDWELIAWSYGGWRGCRIPLGNEDLRSCELHAWRLLWRFLRWIDGGGELLEDFSKFWSSSWDPARRGDLVLRKWKLENWGGVKSCFLLVRSRRFDNLYCRADLFLHIIHLISFWIVLGF